MGSWNPPGREGGKLESPEARTPGRAVPGEARPGGKAFPEAPEGPVVGARPVHLGLVGACIVNSENKIVGIGYNGMPNGCSDDVLPWTRTGANRLDTKYPYVCHAELNAIMNKNSADVKGCSMYVALFPCNECAKLIIQAGIKEVIFMSDKYHDTAEMTAARRMFDLAGIIYREFKPRCSKIIIDFDSINSRPSQKLL
ncbi:Deoxycytidylate deaminase [Turdus rufiventris]|nr:Deoxycytidylate deaminase [Turdus rufiventris]